jgi:hypothetical protein
MAAQSIPYLAQPHVRPVVIAGSRWLAGGVLALVCSAIILAGLVIITQVLMHSFVLVLLLLISLVAVGLVVFLPSLLPQMPGV